MEKDIKFTANVWLVAVLGVSCLIALLLKAFIPNIILPPLDIPTVITICLAALVLDAYLSPSKERAWVIEIILAALTFGVLPLCAGFAGVSRSLLLAVIGGVAFGVSRFFFISITERLATGPIGKPRPILSAFMIFLASACFSGII